MFKVSNSKINTWRRCHYSYYLKYILKLERKVKAGALQRGTLIHECLEAYNTGKSWKKPLAVFEKEFNKATFAEERVELGDIPGMVRELMENYTHYYEEIDEDVTHVENELHFELPLPNNPHIVLEGYIDAVVEDPQGRLWSREYKTYTRSPERDFLVFNMQSGTYTWALNELGYKVEGMLWDIIKAKTPSKPAITQKTKKLSLAKLDSTPYTVRKGIRELGLNPKDYKDFIDKHNYEDFLYRHQVRINKEVVNTIMEDTVSTAVEMMEKGEILKDRNLSKDCSWCSYKSICQADLLGLDTEYIMKAEYNVREKGGRDNGKDKKGQEGATQGKVRRRK